MPEPLPVKRRSINVHVAATGGRGDLRVRLHRRPVLQDVAGLVDGTVAGRAVRQALAFRIDGANSLMAVLRAAGLKTPMRNRFKLQGKEIGDRTIEQTMRLVAFEAANGTATIQVDGGVTVTVSASEGGDGGGEGGQPGGGEGGGEGGEGGDGGEGGNGGGTDGGGGGPDGGLILIGIIVGLLLSVAFLGVEATIFAGLVFGLIVVASQPPAGGEEGEGDTRGTMSGGCIPLPNIPGLG
jgi:hypothetical protein